MTRNRFKSAEIRHILPCPRRKMRLSPFWSLSWAVALGIWPWPPAPDDGSYSANRERLAEMSPEQLEQLSRKRDSFELLMPQERDKLRRLDQELHAEPNAEQLMQTLRGYHEWLSTLRSSEQAKIKDEKDPVARISEIRRLVSSRRQTDIGLTNETRLPPEDNDALRKWVGEFASRQQAEIAKLFPAPDRGPPLGNRRGGQAQVFRFVVSVIRGSIPEDKLAELVSPEDLAQLAESLSPKARGILDNQQTQPEKIRLVFRWVNASFMPRVSEEELRRFLTDALDDKQREIVYRLGPEEGRQELIRLYREFRQRRPPRPPDGEPGEFPREPPPGRPDFDFRPRPDESVPPR